MVLMTEKKKKFVYILAVGLLVVLSGIILYSVDIASWFDLEKLEAMLKENGIWGIALFLAIRCVQTIFVFLPGEIIEIAAGYVYGSFYGLLLCLVGNFLAGYLIFVLVRKYGIKLVQRFYSLEKLREVSFLKNPKRRNILCNTEGFFILCYAAYRYEAIGFFDHFHCGTNSISNYQYIRRTYFR